MKKKKFMIHDMCYNGEGFSIEKSPIDPFSFFRWNSFNFDKAVNLYRREKRTRRGIENFMMNGFWCSKSVRCCLFSKGICEKEKKKKSLLKNCFFKSFLLTQWEKTTQKNTLDLSPDHWRILHNNQSVKTKFLCVHLQSMFAGAKEKATNFRVG